MGRYMKAAAMGRYEFEPPFFIPYMGCFDRKGTICKKYIDNRISL